MTLAPMDEMLEEAPELALYPASGSLGEYLHLRVHVDVNAVPVQVLLQPNAYTL